MTGRWRRRWWLLGLAAGVLALAAAAMAGALLAHQRWLTPPPPPTPARPYASACVQSAYCQPPLDSICTIIYLAEQAGTPPEQIIIGLAQDPALRAEDFDACPEFRIYWEAAQQLAG